MKELRLTKGFTALVDDDVFDRARHLSWFYDRGYGARKTRTEGKVYLHRWIFGATATQEIDHVNGNGLDNRRCNLRVATRSTNMANGPPNSRNKSGFRGVSYHARTQTWQASIQHQGRSMGLGYFLLPEEAARAYDAAALQLFGAYARPNFPDGR